MSEISISRLRGPALESRLPDLASLRITVFRDFPYLYDGSEDYEQRYLASYAEAEDSVIVGALAGEQLIGAATGLPLAHEPESVQAPFRARGMPLETIFYFGESVLLRPYRGQGLGVAFFKEREAHVRELGRFTTICFCGVVRPPDHPRRPEGFVPLDAFWRRRGYAPLEGAIGHLSWRDLDEAEETPKPMQFWTKQL